MAYGLPSRGQRDWDDELNNSIEALNADVQSATAQAAVAASDAAYARNRADEVHTAVLSGADGATAGFINDSASETAQALTATIGTAVAPKATKGGKTKTDGQNIKNLRRPTLVIDTTFPNARVDHTILYVDEVAGRLYAIGKDGSLRLQTWTPGAANIDYGAVAGTRSRVATNKEWALHGLFFRTASGALLMEEFDRGAGTTKIIRSTSASDGLAWTDVLALRGDAIPLGPQSIAQDPVTGYLYFAEYSGGTTLTDIRIYRSTDDGVTWPVWVTRPKSAGGAGTFRHFHSARYDSVSQRVYFCVGDQNDIAGLYRVNAAGTDIEPVITNAQLSAQFGLTAPARAVDVMFFPTHIAWGCDGSGGQNHIYRIARTEIDKPSPVVEQVAAIDNTAWLNQRASADGSLWLCSASSEIGGGPNPDTGVAHLYAVSNNGADVDEVAAVAMDGVYGAGSLSAVPGPPGGDAFWLRAHGHLLPPFNQNSGFQFRARIAHGAVPLIKPLNARPLVYAPESRNFVGDLTMGQTKTFAHTRVGRTRRLRILNMGVKVLTGAANTVKLQVYNVTTSTVVHELPVGYQSWRHGFLGDAAEFAYEYLLSESDQIEFRLVEIGTGPVTVSAFIEFGFAAHTIN